MPCMLVYILKQKRNVRFSWFCIVRSSQDVATKINQNVYQTSDTQKMVIILFLSSYLEELLNLMCTQLFPLSSGSYSTKRDTFYVKWQSETSDNEKNI